MLSKRIGFNQKEFLKIIHNNSHSFINILRYLDNSLNSKRQGQQSV